MTSASRIAALVGGAVGAAMLGVTIASAQEETAPDASLAAAPVESTEPAAIDFNDAHAAIASGSGPGLNIRVAESAPRFNQPEIALQSETAEAPRRYEYQLAAQGGERGVDVAIAQRATMGVNEDGDINRQGRGSEVRIGRGLVEERAPTPGRSSTYVFVASDNEALTWSPGARANGGGATFGLMEDRVEMGDVSAGVTWERGTVQASIAYVEREISTTVGRESFSQNENFAGFTLTMRR
ncbi:MAG: hypothetical protein JNK94_06650 [Hyphomonadaceae bacterium]|nr:hypothetical protein [Hyphomonadaceae bacterium]